MTADTSKFRAGLEKASKRVDDFIKWLSRGLKRSDELRINKRLSYRKINYINKRKSYAH